MAAKLSVPGITDGLGPIRLTILCARSYVSKNLSIIVLMTFLMIHKYLTCAIYLSVFITPWPKVKMPPKRTTVIGSHRKINSLSSAIRAEPYIYLIYLISPYILN